MDGGELVGGPDREDDEEDEAGEIDGAASAQARVTANKNHAAVGDPHGEGEEDLGVAEVGGAVGLLGDERTEEQAGGHAGETEKEGLEGDLVSGFEGREPGERGSLVLEAAFLDEVEQ